MISQHHHPPGSLLCPTRQLATRPDSDQQGLITSTQLDAAINAQLISHKRLGEVLMEQGLLTQKQLSKPLKKQSNQRLADTLVAALMTPFQMASADIQRLQPPSAISQDETARGMQSLSDSEISAAAPRVSTT
nr:hypothetical protein [Pseudomonas sp. o96-267]